MTFPTAFIHAFRNSVILHEPVGCFKHDAISSVCAVMVFSAPALLSSALLPTGGGLGRVGRRVKPSAKAESWRWWLGRGLSLSLSLSLSRYMSLYFSLSLSLSLPLCVLSLSLSLPLCVLALSLSLKV